MAVSPQMFLISKKQRRINGSLAAHFASAASSFTLKVTTSGAWILSSGQRATTAAVFSMLTYSNDNIFLCMNLPLWIPCHMATLVYLHNICRGIKFNCRSIEEKKNSVKWLKKLGNYSHVNLHISTACWLMNKCLNLEHYLDRVLNE